MSVVRRVSLRFFMVIEIIFYFVFSKCFHCYLVLFQTQKRVVKSIAFTGIIWSLHIWFIIILTLVLIASK